MKALKTPLWLVFLLAFLAALNIALGVANGRWFSWVAATACVASGLFCLWVHFTIKREAGSR